MRWTYATLTLAYCAGIWWLSSLPEPPTPPYEIPGLDKVVHAVLFGGLAALAGRGLRRSGRIYSPRTLFWAPLIFASTYGAVDELHQYFVPPRESSVGDLLADIAGALLIQILLSRYRPQAHLQRD